ncbi:hypothetical protein Egran_05720 [Elaphomyces granulatus]|uniref:G-patch domain-containing protein n=1 Tax=Elaphomyces granulatus TaxID=519963 RepID=A0A232LQV8_9EURO|nr:hypothetical protein Egran_05720 [Elaphomyces granulatus]
MSRQPSSAIRAGEKKADGAEEDDYMSMTISEPQGKETFTQRKLRKQRMAEARAKVPSKAERAAEDAARREAALSSSILDPSNKGYQMMAKLGFKTGDALGKRASTGNGMATKPETAATAYNCIQPHREPLSLVIKEDRGGIGLDNEKKRKFRDEAGEAAKRTKAEEVEYRDRMRLEREERRTEAHVHAAQKITEGLDSSAEEQIDTTNTAGDPDLGAKLDTGVAASRTRSNIKRTAKINVLYRGLVREREQNEQLLLTRHALETSSPSSFFPNPKLPTYDDSILDHEDEQALGLGQNNLAPVEQEPDEDDLELDEFNALDPHERLEKLVMYLREEHRYCFWCKYQYETEEMDGCPGVTEEEHD